MMIQLYCTNCEKIQDCQIEVSEPRLAAKSDSDFHIDIQAEAVCTECNHGVDIDTETFTFSVY